MGPLVVGMTPSGLCGHIDGGRQRRRTQGGETLRAAATIELYRTNAVLPPRPRSGVARRLIKAPVAAIRSGRSS